MSIQGRSRFIGTQRHTFATNLIEEYQAFYGDRGLRTNVRFLDTQNGPGILDVKDIRNLVIYDYKSGYPNYTIQRFLNAIQMIIYQQSSPNISITIFHFR